MKHKLTQEEMYRKKAGLGLLHLLSDEKSVVAKPLKSSAAGNVPKGASSSLDRIIKNEQCHEVYGSLALSSQSFVSRTPGDCDIIVRNPNITAEKISTSFKRQGYKTEVEKNPEYGSAVVRVKKGNKFVDVADIHPVKDHYGDFDVYGSSKLPKKVAGVNIQPASDQLLRKGNSVMGYNEQDKRMGATEKRRTKDNEDFITTARLLLDSRELRANAELRRVQHGRKKLSVWKKHARKLKGYDSKKTYIGKDPIPQNKENQFIAFALSNPKVNINDIYFSGSGIKLRSETISDPVCPFSDTKKASDPYSEIFGKRVKSPYKKKVKSPYKKKVKSPYRKKKSTKKAKKIFKKSSSPYKILRKKVVKKSSKPRKKKSTRQKYTLF